MKSELLTNPKFKRLCRIVGLPTPYVAGLLELLWQVGYSLASEVIGDAVDVEVASEWPGEPGAWAAALLRERWIEERDGKFVIHDFWEHVPQYVERKRDRRGSKSERVTSHRLVGDESPTSLRLAYPTQPNPTQPDKTPIPPPAPRAEPPPEGRTSGTPSPQREGSQDPGHEPQRSSRTAAPEGADPPGFLRFWAAYPDTHRKRGPAKCRRHWDRHKLEAIAETVIAGLERWKASAEWAKQRGAFIPGPVPFLNVDDRKWEARPPAASTATRELDLPRGLGSLPAGVEDR